MKAMKIPVVAQDAVKELLKSIDWTQYEKKDKKRNDEDFVHEKERLEWEDEIEIER